MKPENAVMLGARLAVGESLRMMNTTHVADLLDEDSAMRMATAIHDFQDQYRFFDECLKHWLATNGEIALAYDEVYLRNQEKEE